MGAAGLPIVAGASALRADIWDRRSLWGDGFADDHWISLLRVLNWEDCSRDEYVLLFPNLVPRDGQIPIAIRRFLDELVDHYPDRRPDAWLNWRDDRGEVVSDAVFLGNLWRDLKTDGSARVFDTPRAVRFSFASGVHAAYIWPEAALADDLYAAAGWLGCLARRRRAILPETIAAYFRDVIETDRQGVCFLRDRRLAPLCDDAALTARLRKWSMLRQQKPEVVARLPRLLWRPRSVPGMSFSARSRAGFQADAVATSTSERSPGSVKAVMATNHTNAAFSFVINGRFVGRPITGVQRYAHQVVSAIDGLLRPEADRVSLVVPPKTPIDVAYRAIEIEARGFGAGQIWEQATLASGGKPVLNLCNTAPLLGSTNIVCIHDLNVFETPESYHPAFRAFYKTLQPSIARRAAGLATVSAFSASGLAKQFDIPIGRISVLPNGHEHVFGWQASRSRLGAALMRPYVLLLGSRAKHKNIMRIIGLAEALDERGLDVVVAGGASSIFADENFQSSRNVKRLGRVSDDDLALLLNGALCLAFPSLTEGFGLPVLEAMALGCPVIATDRASLPELCGSAALQADPNDDASWLGGIRRLHESADLQTDLRGRGRERAALFRWTDTAEGYLQIVERLRA